MHGGAKGMLTWTMQRGPFGSGAAGSSQRSKRLQHPHGRTVRTIVSCIVLNHLVLSRLQEVSNVSTYVYHLVFLQQLEDGLALFILQMGKLNLGELSNSPSTMTLRQYYRHTG